MAACGMPIPVARLTADQNFSLLAQTDYHLPRPPPRGAAVTSPLDGRDGSLDPELTQASQAIPPSKDTIGSYRLLQLVGEGGMGEVWLAEQTRPVHRQVALKVIKAGMDTEQVVARFEAERQALALMSHPAIAQVFDAGATVQGRPFFAMEYVRGEPMTTYCARHRL